MAETSSDAAESRRDADLTDRVTRLLSVVWQVPKRWIALMMVAAVLTSVKVTRSPEGKYGVDLAVGTLAIVALGLIWLPALLRLLVLTGGSLKAGNIEASAQGLLTPEDLFELGTRTKAVVTAQDDAATRSVAIAELDAAFDRLAKYALPPEQPLASLIRDLGGQYERLRRDTPSGPQRTSAMTRIVNQARVRAAMSPDMARLLVPQLLRSTSAGERIVGLAFAQETAPVEAFREILPLIPGSASAFEMYHALLALQELSSVLAPADRDQAIATLEAERKDPRGIGISADPGLPTLIDRTLMQLRSHGQRG